VVSQDTLLLLDIVVILLTVVYLVTLATMELVQ